jgi:nucleoside-diphosphate-sugar epimerase
MILASENANAVGRTFNIGSGTPTTISSLVQLLTKTVGTNGIRPIHLRTRPGDIEQSYADIQQAKDVMKFRPKLTLEHALII